MMPRILDCGSRACVEERLAESVCCAAEAVAREAAVHERCRCDAAPEDSPALVLVLRPAQAVADMVAAFHVLSSRSNGSSALFRSAVRCYDVIRSSLNSGRSRQLSCQLHLSFESRRVIFYDEPRCALAGEPALFAQRIRLDIPFPLHRLASGLLRHVFDPLRKCAKDYQCRL